MKKLISMLVVLVIAAAANASIATLNNFESYADSAALNAAWVVHTGGEALTETLQTDHTQYMKLYTTGYTSKGWAQTKRVVPGDVELGIHGVNWTYLGFTDIQFDHKVTDKGCEFIQFSLYNCWGETIMSYGNVSPKTISGGIHDWTTTSINLADNLIAGKNYENVAIIGITMKNTYNGVGDVLIDNIILTPEPTTMILLGLGGLLLRKRK